MKKINLTLSLPSQTYKRLESLMPREEINSFVIQLINMAYEQKLSELKSAYLEAEKDVDRNALLADWQNIDDENIENSFDLK